MFLPWARLTVKLNSGRYLNGFLRSKPDVRYFDPETLNLIEDKLPTIIEDLARFSHLEDFEFIQTCYGEDGSLQGTLSDLDRERLIYVFREAAYQRFIDDMQNDTAQDP